MKKRKQLTRAQRFALGAGSTAAYQLISVIAGLIVPRLLIIGYGSSLNGFISFISQFVGYFILVEAGIGLSSTAALYKPLVNGDEEKVSSILVAARNYYYLSGAIFTLLVVALSLVLAFSHYEQSLGFLDTFLLVIFVASYGFLDFFVLAKYKVLLTADIRGYVFNIGNCVYQILRLVIIWMLVSMRASITVVFGAAIFAYVVRSIMVKIYVNRNYDLSFNAKPDKSALNERWVAFTQTLLVNLYSSVPTIILAGMTSLITVSIYSVYNLIATGVQGVVSVLSNNIAPSFGNVLADNNMNKLRAFYYEYNAIYNTLVAICFSSAAILIMPFISIYTAGFTDANYYLPQVGVLFVASGVLSALETSMTGLTNAAGHFRQRRLRTALCTAIIIVAGILLTYFNGLPGMLIACCLALGYRTIELCVYVPKKILLCSPKKTFAQLLLCILFVSIAVVISLIAPFSVSGVMSFVVLMVIVVAVVSLSIVALSWPLYHCEYISLIKRMKRI